MKSVVFLMSVFAALSANAERLICTASPANSTGVALSARVTYVFEGNNVVLANANTFRVTTQPRSDLKLFGARGTFSSLRKFKFNGTATVSDSLPCTALAAGSQKFCQDLNQLMKDEGHRGNVPSFTYVFQNLARANAGANARLTLGSGIRGAETSSHGLLMKCRIAR